MLGSVGNQGEDRGVGMCSMCRCEGRLSRAEDSLMYVCGSSLHAPKGEDSEVEGLAGCGRWALDLYGAGSTNI